ncbi:hypothetical protein [Peptoniphilus sp.]|uniref:hypothetical protein n=1 Tax=Peptoniphilus sp. TaxID=1971214 RepID=UPI002A75D676|nr:hypothetical protein [Peptoniphilus sp.]
MDFPAKTENRIKKNTIIVDSRKNEIITIIFKNFSTFSLALIFLRNIKIQILRLNTIKKFIPNKRLFIIGIQTIYLKLNIIAKENNRHSTNITGPFISFIVFK